MEQEPKQTHPCVGSGSPSPDDPDNAWACDLCGAIVPAATFDLGAEVQMQTAAHRLLNAALYSGAK